MSYICLLMVLCECACANIISKANFNMINKPDLFVCLHIMFQISFQNSKGRTKKLSQVFGCSVRAFAQYRIFVLFYKRRNTISNNLQLIVSEPMISFR